MRVAGLGFRSTATLSSLCDALARAGGAVDALATAAQKADAPALRALAAELGLPLMAIGAEALAAQNTLTHSATVRARFATGSVAEAAALAGAGPGARLLGPRVQSDDGLATAAIAERNDG